MRSAPAQEPESDSHFTPHVIRTCLPYFFLTGGEVAAAAALARPAASQTSSSWSSPALPPGDFGSAAPDRCQPQEEQAVPLSWRPTGSTKHLLRAICYTSALFLLIQVASQVAFHFVPPDGAVWEVVFGDLGILRFNQVDAGNIVRLLGPDIEMLTISLIIIKPNQKLVMPLVPESPSSSHGKEMEEETEEEREAVSESPHYLRPDNDVELWLVKVMGSNGVLGPGPGNQGKVPALSYRQRE
ncbi:uncharacterized protein [Petaurus breviceps papuanus]|uniref:uncharacterized protein n=1 Tax=Petaurus breviceps papuanus TaxID=3040969 RepID=UPI0036DA980C